MKNSGVLSLVLACLLVVCVKCQEKKPEPKVGEPQFSLQAAGAGNNARNYHFGYNAGVGTKVWESKGRSLEVGVNYGRGQARVNGQTYKSPPQFGIGATYRFGRKK